MENHDQEMESTDGHTHPSRNAAKRKAPLEACAICLESITDRAITVPCNHASFDFLCLVSWVQDHPVCPLCKLSRQLRPFHPVVRSTYLPLLGKTNLVSIEYEWVGPNNFETFRIPACSVNSDFGRADAGSQHHRRGSGRGHSRISNPSRSRWRNIRGSRPGSASEEAAINRRRQVYHHMTFSRHVGTNRVSQFREFTPSTFTHSKELQLKAREWIRRELQVFDFLTPSMDAASNHTSGRRYAGNSEFLIEYLISILKTIDIKDHSGKGESMLSGFLGLHRARLFLHELNAWLRSPYTEVGAWDRHVQYPGSGGSC